MRTVRCSGHLSGGGVSAPGSVYLGDVSQHAMRQTPPPPWYYLFRMPSRKGIGILIVYFTEKG